MCVVQQGDKTNGSQFGKIGIKAPQIENNFWDLSVPVIASVWSTSDQRSDLKKKNEETDKTQSFLGSNPQRELTPCYILT